MKARWIGEGDGTKLVGRNEAETKKWKGQQRQGQRNETRIIFQKGLMNIKSKVEMEDRREKPEKMTNWEWFWKKDLGGGGGKTSKTSLELPETLCLYQPFRAPLLKNPRIAGTNGVFLIIISKQNNRHKQKKGRSPQKTEIRNTTTIQTPATGKPGVPKCKKLGFGKGMRWNWP